MAGKFLCRKGVHAALGWAAAAVFALAAGCRLYEAVFAPGLSSFSHARHVEENSMACSECHETQSGDLPPAMPQRAACEACHDAKEEPELFSEFFDSTGPRWIHAGLLAEEVRFPHNLHAVTHKISCTRCHADVAGASQIKGGAGLRMNDCLGCHKDQGGRCEFCHKRLNKDTRPTTHSASWTLVHGEVVRAGPTLRTADRCALCHTPGDCDTCHTQRKPRDHTTHWRGKGHGVAAGIDRERCAVCHTRDVCDRCHKTTRPRDHRGSFGGPRNRHCLSCHMPLDYSESCAVCHTETPSHERAPAPPSDAVHRTALPEDCRPCHMPGAHADNGDDCRWCHR